MAIRIVRLGTPRARGEGVRLGTVRRPPRGVPRSRFASENWYDVWLPNLAPSAELFAFAKKKITDERGWTKYRERYAREMARPDASRVLDALAALSHEANFSVGCYCEDEAHCHRSVLRQILKEHGAVIVE